MFRWDERTRARALPAQAPVLQNEVPYRTAPLRHGYQEVHVLLCFDDPLQRCSERWRSGSYWHVAHVPGACAKHLGHLLAQDWDA